MLAHPLPLLISDASPLPPWATALVLCGLVAIVNISVGTWPPPEDLEARTRSLWMVTFMGNLFVAVGLFPGLVNAARRALRDAWPGLDVSREGLDSAVECLDRPGRAWMLGAVLFTIPAWVAGGELLGDLVSRFGQHPWDLRFIWFQAVGFVSNVFIWQAGAALLHVTRVVGKTGALAKPLVLLHPGNVVTLPGLGVRATLLASIYLAWFAGSMLFAGVYGAWQTSGVFFHLFAVTAIVLIGGASLFLTTNPLRERLAELKREEVLRLEAALAGHREALDECLLASEADALRGVALLQYLDRVESASEWPIPARLVRRFLFILLIPSLSWVGGALVERLISYALD